MVTFGQGTQLYSGYAKALYDQALVKERLLRNGELDQGNVKAYQDANRDILSVLLKFRRHFITFKRHISSTHRNNFLHKAIDSRVHLQKYPEIIEGLLNEISDILRKLTRHLSQVSNLIDAEEILRKERSSNLLEQLDKRFGKYSNDFKVLSHEVAPDTKNHFILTRKEGGFFTLAKICAAIAVFNFAVDRRESMEGMHSVQGRQLQELGLDEKFMKTIGYFLIERWGIFQEVAREINLTLKPGRNFDRYFFEYFLSASYVDGQNQRIHQLVIESWDAFVQGIHYYAHHVHDKSTLLFVIETLLHNEHGSKLEKYIDDKKLVLEFIERYFPGNWLRFIKTVIEIDNVSETGTDIPILIDNMSKNPVTRAFVLQNWEEFVEGVVQIWRSGRNGRNLLSYLVAALGDVSEENVEKARMYFSDWHRLVGTLIEMSTKRRATTIDNNAAIRLFKEAKSYEDLADKFRFV